jgi:hypothetical protein
LFGTHFTVTKNVLLGAPLTLCHFEMDAEGSPPGALKSLYLRLRKRFEHVQVLLGKLYPGFALKIFLERATKP